jgi:arylsulfatase A-like enzyme
MRLLVSFLCLLVLGAPAIGATPPNVVFIMADDLGWRDVGCYGNAFVETPHLDRLARDGMRFTRALQQTVCSPTRVALLTGMHPVRTGITDYLGPEAGALFLDPKVDTINERLKEAGYRSGLVGKWHLTGNYKAAKGSPDKHGWDEVIASETDYIGGGSYFHPYRHIAELPARLGEGEHLTDRLNLEACDFITRNKDKPFFLYFSHYAVHTKLAAKPHLVEKYEKKLAALPPDAAAKVGTKPALAAMMESVDEGIGQIRETLVKLGLEKNTLIIFTSDNGGEAVRGAPGGKLVPGVTSVAPLRAGKSHLYEGGLRVPLIVSWPGVTPASSVCDAPVNGLDWYPTLLAIAGVKPRGPQPMDGTGIVGLLQNPKEKREGAMYWHYPLAKPHFLGGRSAGAMRDGDWKLIEFFDTGEVELYDLATDDGERKNLAREMPERAATMQRQLREWRASVGARVPPRVTYLENKRLKIGVDLDAGGSIGWLSAKEEPNKNLLNAYDHGRYVQQSYYGDPDGSDWNGKPWRYNPVQGGDWRGTAAKVVEVKSTSPTDLYTATQPRHWANGKLLDECLMEQWITLKGPMVHIKYRFTYNGTAAHKAHHQELPAVFVDAAYDTLAFCEGAPWTDAPVTRRQPGEKNEYVTFTEPWLAWVNADDVGLGVLAPRCKMATCYRVPGKAACSYVAPLDTFALTPGLKVEHEVWLTAGSLQAIRERFKTLSSR